MRKKGEKVMGLISSHHVQMTQIRLFLIIILVLMDNVYGAGSEDYDSDVETPHSKLLPEYGVLFEKIGILHHNLESYDVVLGLEMPKVRDLEVRSLPYLFCKEDERFEHLVEEICTQHNGIMHTFNEDVADFNSHLQQNIVSVLYDILPKLTGSSYTGNTDTYERPDTVEYEAPTPPPLITKNITEPPKPPPATTPLSTTTTSTHTLTPPTPDTLMGRLFKREMKRVIDMAKSTSSHENPHFETSDELLQHTLDKHSKADVLQAKEDLEYILGIYKDRETSQTQEQGQSNKERRSPDEITWGGYAKPQKQIAIPTTTHRPRPKYPLLDTEEHHMEYVISKRKKRGIDWTDIAVAFPGPLGAIGVHEKERRLKAAIEEVGEQVSVNREGIIHLRDSLVAVGKKTAQAIKELQTYTNRMNDRLQEHSLSLIHLWNKTDQIQADLRYFANVQRLTNYVTDLFLKLTARMIFDQEQTKRAMDNFVTGLDDLASGYLSHHLVSPLDIKKYITEIENQLAHFHPKYKVMNTEEHFYYNIPNIQIGLNGSALLIIIPIYLIKENQGALTLYNIKTTPVPAINTTQGERLYTSLKLKYKYLAAGQTNFITLDKDELDKCQAFGNQFYCETLLIQQSDKSKGCESALFYQIEKDNIPNLCKAMVSKGGEPKPVVFDAGDNVLIAHAPPPWQIISDTTDILPQNMNSAPYAVIKRKQLCKKSLQLGTRYYISGTLEACDSHKVTLYYTINSIFQQALKRKIYNVSSKDIDELLDMPPEVVIPSVRVDEDPIPGISGQSEIELSHLIDQLESSDEVYFSRSSLSGMNKIFAKWAKPTDIMLYVALIMGILGLGLCVLLIAKHKQLRNSVLGIMSAMGIPLVKADSPPKEVSILTYASLFSTIIVIGILMLMLCCYYVYVQFRLNDKIHSILCLVISGNKHKALVKLQEIEATPIDIWHSGKIATMDIMLDKHILTDYLFVNWKNFQLYENEGKINPKAYTSLNFLTRGKVRRIFQEGLKGVKPVVMYHGYMYKVSTMNEISKDYLDKIAVTNNPSEEKILGGDSNEELNESHYADVLLNKN